MTSKSSLAEVHKKENKIAEHLQMTKDWDMTFLTRIKRRRCSVNELLFTIVTSLALIYWIAFSRHSPIKYLSSAPDAMGQNNRSVAQKFVPIDRAEQAKHTYKLEGLLFKKDKESLIQAEVTTSLLYSFSPQLEKTMKSKFVDPPDENFYYGLGPSIIWDKNEFLVVSRVWLARMKHKLKAVPKFPNNTFVINWLFKQKYDKGMIPTDSGELVGVPIPPTKKGTDGIMDPRIFSLKDELFVIGQQASYLGNKFWRPHPIIWDLQRNIPIIPMAPETNPNRTEFKEKNWIPLVIGDDLYLFQNMDPMRLMKCDLKGSCTFVVNEENGESGYFDFDEFKIVFRGGTSFIEYEWPYYLSVAHGVLHRLENGEDHRYYTSSLALIRVHPTFRFVYVSGDIKFHPDIYKGIEDVTYFGQVPIGNDFVFPISFVLENMNSIAIGAHINDNVSVILRLRGFESILRAAMEIDQSQEFDNYTLQPWRLQNSVAKLLTKVLA